MKMDPNAVSLRQDWDQTLEDPGDKLSRDLSQSCKVAYRDSQLCVASFVLSARTQGQNPIDALT